METLNSKPRFILSFAERRKEIEQKECDHVNIEVSESEWLIYCADCHVALDPIWYLLKWSRFERDVQFKVDMLKENLKALEARRRFKCVHCGKVNTL